MAIPGTLSELLFHVRQVSAGRADLLTVDRDGRRHSVSTADFLRAVHSLALALEIRGLNAGERVAIVSENRPEWHVVDFACHLLGAPTVPIDPCQSSDRLGYVLRNSGCRWVFFSDAKTGEVLRSLTAALTVPPECVAFEGRAALKDGTTVTRLQGVGAEHLADMPLERFRGRVNVDDLATLVFTSGTTGEPKGVMLSHGNLMSNVAGCAQVFNVSRDDVSLSVQPLSHVYQRTVDYLCLLRGARVHYVAQPDGLASQLLAVRPSVMAASPQIYAAVHQSLQERIERSRRRHMARWAIGVGRRHATASRHGFIGPLLALQRWVSQRLILRHLQAPLGGRMRLAISGGAALATEVESFFHAIGLPIYQGYGLTETSPVLTSNSPEHYKLGSVGQAIPGVELRVADSGEILARGSGVMQGYWQNPSATAVVMNDGWLSTGDLGRVDKDGFLFIEGRVVG